MQDDGCKQKKSNYIRRCVNNIKTKATKQNGKHVRCDRFLVIAVRVLNM